MSMHAALKAERALQLAISVVAVEILCACQAIDLRAPLSSSPALMRAHTTVRECVPMLVHDRPPAPDLDAIGELIRGGKLEYRARHRCQLIFKKKFFHFQFDKRSTTA